MVQKARFSKLRNINYLDDNLIYKDGVEYCSFNPDLSGVQIMKAYILKNRITMSLKLIDILKKKKIYIEQVNLSLRKIIIFT